MTNKTCSKWLATFYPSSDETQKAGCAYMSRDTVTGKQWREGQHRWKRLALKIMPEFFSGGKYESVSLVAQSSPTFCDLMDCSTLGLPVHYQFPEFAQTHVRWVGDAIQPSHPLSSPFPPAFNLSQHQGLFKWVSSSHQVAKVLEFQLQHQSFQWTPRTDLL